jgi:methylmalonyl-CoA mutase N-terminal domain/subunit
LSVAFDMPTLMGIDADHPLAHGEIGHCGVAISSLDDMERLFEGIPLDQVTTSMTINGPAAAIFAMYLAVAEKRNIRPERLNGTLQNDILKEYIAQKEWLFPPEPSLRLITDTIAYCAEHVPKWHPVSISGYHIREAGSTAVQELAFTLYDGLTYVEAAVKAGLSVDRFAPQLSFFFNAHNDFFEEIAKFRAARRLWAREMSDRYRPNDPRSVQLRCHAQTAGCSLTAQQPMNNVVRTTIQALAAVLGGTQSLHTNSMDETLALPTEGSVKLALRTQQIIAQESGVTNSVDPLGGSYFVETLTDRLEEAALDYFRQLDDMGGMVRAIERGFPQREILDASQRYQRELEDRTGSRA